VDRNPLTRRDYASEPRRHTRTEAQSGPETEPKPEAQPGPEVQIEKWVYGGARLARADGKVLMIP
jgi:hypothetical protein